MDCAAVTVPRKCILLFIYLLNHNFFISLAAVQTFPCFGQDYLSATIHIGEIQDLSRPVHIVGESYWSEWNSSDCAFNQYGVYHWTIDEIDISAPSGLKCLGGGVGFPWYRFRIYGKDFITFNATIWITWQGPPQEERPSPVYLFECV